MWGQFSIKGNNHDVMKYLTFTYITHATKFVRCFINRVLHFSTTTTSRGESGHAMLKKHLGTSTKDLKTIINGIDLLLLNQYQNHRLTLKNVKTRYSFDLNKFFFRKLRAFITP